MDTVENIGISCNLLSYNEKIFKIKMAPKDDENNNDNNNNNNDNIDINNGIEIRNFISSFKLFLEKNIQEFKNTI